MKRCPRCKELHPLSEFYRDTRRPDGLSIWCRTCKYPRTVKKHSGPQAKGNTAKCVNCGQWFSTNTIHRHRVRCRLTRHGSTADLSCPCGRTHENYAARRRCSQFLAGQAPPVDD